MEEKEKDEAPKIEVYKAKNGDCVIVDTRKGTVIRLEHKELLKFFVQLESSFYLDRWEKETVQREMFGLDN
jgi:hypothetical protein